MSDSTTIETQHSSTFFFYINVKTIMQNKNVFNNTPDNISKILMQNIH